MNLAAFAARASTMALALTAIVCVAGVVGLVLVPQALGLRELVVLSDSMQPSVPKGGLALVEPLGLGEVPQVGDVIAFARPDGDHSVVSRRTLTITDHLGGPTIWTKADASDASDPWALRPDQVRGRVRYTIPHAGAFARWLHSPVGFILALAMPSGLIALWVVNQFSEQRREHELTQTLVESRLRSAFRNVR
jgi:signal peptidase